MTLPPPARADHLGDLTLRNRVGDGLDAHRARGPRPGPARARGVLRRARPRRRRPDRHRRLRAQPARLAQAVRLRDDHAGCTRRGTARSPTPCTPRAARSRCRCCTPAATATTRSASRASRHEVADHAVQARARCRREGVDRTVDDFARRVALARKAGYDGVEIMGSEGYLINQFLAAAHQRPHRRVGRLGREPDALPRRGRAPRRARRSATDFPIDLPDLAARPGRGRPDLGRGRRRSPSSSRRPASTVLNTGIGWHEARVPTIITQVPRGAWRCDDRPAQGRGVGPGRAPPTGSTPPRSPRRSWPPASADLVSMARPLLADPEFVAKAAAGRADEINTCIACNQACLDHDVRATSARPAWSTRAPAARPSWCCCRPRARHAHASRSSAPGRPASPPRSSAAERGYAVTLFEKSAELGGQFRLAMADPRQGGVRRDAALLRAAGSRCSASTCGSATEADAGRPRGVRRGRRRHRRRAADARRSPASTTRASCRTPTC